MALSDAEIQSLAKKARELENSANAEGDTVSCLKEAIRCYDRIIKHRPISFYNFERRSNLKYTLAQEFDSTFYLIGAIADIDRAIEIEPNEGNYYRIRGLYRMRLIGDEEDPRSKDFEQTLGDFRACIGKDPTLPMVWLHMLALNVMRQDWDEAISVYGQCNPYIHNEEHLLMKSFLGCLALAFAGDPIEEEDMEPLRDKGIELETTSVCTGLVKVVSFSVGRRFQAEQNQARKERVEEIIVLLISHVDSWMSQGILFKEYLGNFEEALKAFDKAIDFGVKVSYAWNNKGTILENHLGRPEEALECYKKAMQIDPSDLVAEHNRFRLAGQLCRRRMEGDLRKLFRNLFRTKDS